MWREAGEGTSAGERGEEEGLHVEGSGAGGGGGRRGVDARVGEGGVLGRVGGEGGRREMGWQGGGERKGCVGEGKGRGQTRKRADIALRFAEVGAEQAHFAPATFWHPTI